MSQYRPTHSKQNGKYLSNETESQLIAQRMAQPVHFSSRERRIKKVVEHTKKGKKSCV